MSVYGSHSSEAEVRAEYEAAKRKVYDESHGHVLLPGTAPDAIDLKF